MNVSRSEYCSQEYTQLYTRSVRRIEKNMDKVSRGAGEITFGRMIYYIYLFSFLGTLATGKHEYIFFSFFLFDIIHVSLYLYTLYLYNTIYISISIII